MPVVVTALLTTESTPQRLHYFLLVLLVLPSTDIEKANKEEIQCHLLLCVVPDFFHKILGQVFIHFDSEVTAILQSLVLRIFISSCNGRVVNVHLQLLTGSRISIVSVLRQYLMSCSLRVATHRQSGGTRSQLVIPKLTLAQPKIGRLSDWERNPKPREYKSRVLPTTL